MREVHQHDIPHKLALYRLLEAILSDKYLANVLIFKGGTCAAMLGYLDRFSVDLDFDLPDKEQKADCRQHVELVIAKCGFRIKDQSSKHLQYFLKYREVERGRSILKLDIVELVSFANRYEKKHLLDIGRFCRAQTVDTMFANKLVACKSRYERTGYLAGRDVYDIYHFLHQGYKINWAVIEDLRQASARDYISELIGFLTKEVRDKLLSEDLNTLISAEALKTIVPHIKQEVIWGLQALL